MARFERTLRGDLTRPDDPAFDEARTIYDATNNKRPHLIARYTTVADVIAAVSFGRERGLGTAGRGSGHSGPGLALVNDGLDIDRSAMKGIDGTPAIPSHDGQIID